VSFAAITLCVASQRAFIVVYFVIDSVRKLLDIPSCCKTKRTLGKGENETERKVPINKEYTADN
jgi:uncharacterized membrane protein